MSEHFGGKCFILFFSSAKREIASLTEHSTGRKHGTTKAPLPGDGVLKVLVSLSTACLSTIAATSEAGWCERCCQT